MAIGRLPAESAGARQLSAPVSSVMTLLVATVQATESGTEPVGHRLRCLTKGQY